MRAQREWPAAARIASAAAGVVSGNPLRDIARDARI
jgi:hypothetical protein